MERSVGGLEIRASLIIFVAKFPSMLATREAYDAESALWSSGKTGRIRIL